MKELPIQDPWDLVRTIREDAREDLKELIHDTASNILKQKPWDTRPLYEYFSKVYDSLYHDFLFKRLELDKETQRMLEMLATPIYQKSPPEQRQFFKDKNLPYE